MIEIIKIKEENGLNKYIFLPVSRMSLVESKSKNDNLLSCSGIEIVTEQELYTDLIEGIELKQFRNNYTIQGIRLNQSVTGIVNITPTTKNNPITVKKDGEIVENTVYTLSSEPTLSVMIENTNEIEVVAEGIPITNVNELQAMTNDNIYYLANDIDCSDTRNWNLGAGFRPLGTLEVPFNSVLDGNNMTISNLYINRPEENAVSLLGITRVSNRKVGTTNIYTPPISNVKFKGCTVIGGDNVALVYSYMFKNISNTCSITDIKAINCWVEAKNTSGIVGGLFGKIGEGTVFSLKNCYFSGGTVKGTRLIGGIAYAIRGEYQTNSSGITVQKCFFSGNIIQEDTILDSICTIGGICGVLTSATGVRNTVVANMLDCYFYGKITYNSESLSSNIGGLVGVISASSSAGAGWATASIGNSYANVRFFGVRNPILDPSKWAVCYGNKATSYTTISNTYFNKDFCNQQNKSDKGILDADMRTDSSFVGFNFNTTWSTNGGMSYPFLIENPEPAPEEVKVLGHIYIDNYEIPYCSFEDTALKWTDHILTFNKTNEVFALIPNQNGDLKCIYNNIVKGY